MSAVKIRIDRFWTNYMPDPKKTGGMRAIDMVEYSPIGQIGKTSVVEAVSRLAKLHPIEMGESNPAIRAAHDRWDIIRPAYEAWKANEEIPVTGTPLAAWGGLSKTQADALRHLGLRTVEEVAEASDSIVSRIPVPNARKLPEMARAFLNSADASKNAAEFSQLKDANAVLQEQVEELMAMLKGGEAPKRRGRPPNVKVEEAA